MGLLNEGINEVIATTRFNAAPMGVFSGRVSLPWCSFPEAIPHTILSVTGGLWQTLSMILSCMSRPHFLISRRMRFFPVTVKGREMHRLGQADAWQAFDAVVGHHGTESMTARLSPLYEEILSSTVPAG